MMPAVSVIPGAEVCTGAVKGAGTRDAAVSAYGNGNAVAGSGDGFESVLTTALQEHAPATESGRLAEGGSTGKTAPGRMVQQLDAVPAETVAPPGATAAGTMKSLAPGRVLPAAGDVSVTVSTDDGIGQNAGVKEGKAKNPADGTVPGKEISGKSGTVVSSESSTAAAETKGKIESVAAAEPGTAAYKNVTVYDINTAEDSGAAGLLTHSTVKDGAGSGKNAGSGHRTDAKKTEIASQAPQPAMTAIGLAPAAVVPVGAVTVQEATKIATREREEVPVATAGVKAGAKGRAAAVAAGASAGKSVAAQEKDSPVLQGKGQGVVADSGGTASGDAKAGELAGNSVQDGGEVQRAVVQTPSAGAGASGLVAQGRDPRAGNTLANPGQKSATRSDASMAHGQAAVTGSTGSISSGSGFTASLLQVHNATGTATVTHAGLQHAVGSDSVSAGAANPYERMDEPQRASLVFASQQKMTMAVNDPSLGSFEVRAQSAGAQVAASLATVSAATHAQLSGHLPSLTTFLQDRRVDVSRVTVVHHGTTGGDGGARGFGGQSQQGQSGSSNSDSSRGGTPPRTVIGGDAGSGARSISGPSGWSSGASGAPAVAGTAVVTSQGAGISYVDVLA